MKKITVVIPCYNEESNVPRLYESLSAIAGAVRGVDIREDGAGMHAEIDLGAYEWEFMFINDGSEDNTLEAVERLRLGDERVGCLNLSRNFGKENALLAGLDYASGDAVVIMDADLQHPVDSIPEMIFWWERGYDDIYAQRLSRGREPAVRKFMTKMFYKSLQRMAKIDILPDAGDYRLLDRSAVNALRSMRESQRYTKALYCWIGFRKKGVPFRQNERTSGKSSFRYRDLVNLAVDGITSYSTTPLRISTIAGFLISFLSFAYLIFILVKTLIWGEDVEGFPTLICVILLLGGLQLLALGIIGEYIGRIFNETKGRPDYIVESYNGRRSGK